MGIFHKIFKMRKIYSPEDFSYIIEIAGLISDNDCNIVKNLAECADDPFAYIDKKQNRFLERGICDSPKGTIDADDICWIALIEELSDHGFLAEMDYKCDLDDFLFALEKLKKYSVIADSVQMINMHQSNDVETWIEAINLALNGRAFIGMIDIDSDSYCIIIVTSDVYEKISDIARMNGHKILP